MNLALLTLILSLLLVSTGNADSEKFALAIVRIDGSLVPFAAYDNGRWQNPWPEADEAMERKYTLHTAPSIWRKRGEPVPSLWHAWPATGGSPSQANVKGIETVEAHCQGQLALKTDLPVKARRANLGEIEHEKFGVAVNTTLPINSIEELTRPSAEWKAAYQAIAASFSKLEAAQAQTDKQQVLKETPTPAVQITGLYREAKSTASPLYFVAEKKYKTSRYPEDARCNALTLMTGWLMPIDSGAFTLRDTHVFLTDCDQKEARTALPLAAFRVSGQHFWILQEHGYEDESYIVAEIGPAKARYVIEVNGGGC